jgi:hypothetical protein
VVEWTVRLFHFFPVFTPIILNSGTFRCFESVTPEKRNFHVEAARESFWFLLQKLKWLLHTHSEIKMQKKRDEELVLGNVRITAKYG